MLIKKFSKLTYFFLILVFFLYSDISDFISVKISEEIKLFDNSSVQQKNYILLPKGIHLRLWLI